MLKSFCGISIAIVCCLVGLTTLQGCASTPRGGGAETSERLTSIAASVREGQDRVRAVTASLNDLVTNPADLSKQFGQYVKNLDSLESQAKKIRDSAAKMSKEVDSYIAKWSEELAQIKNEDIRARSKARQEQVDKGLKQIQSHYQALADAFKPLMANLQDIETALKTDLTRSGVESLSKIAATTLEQAKAVLARADEVAADFEALGVAMSSAAAPAAKSQ